MKGIQLFYHYHYATNTRKVSKINEMQEQITMLKKLHWRSAFLPSLSINTIATTDPGNKQN